METLEKFFSSSVPNTKYFLNAPAFLFVSTNVCTHFPKIMESIVVKAYFSHLPGEMLSRKWRFNSSTLDPTRSSFLSLRTLTVFTTLFGLLKLMGSAPFIYQRAVIRLTQPLFVTGAMYVFIKYITANMVGISVTVLLVVALASCLYWRSHRRFVNELQKVAAINSNTVDMYYLNADPKSKSNAASSIDDESSFGTASTSGDDLDDLDEDLSAPAVLQRSTGARRLN